MVREIKNMISARVSEKTIARDIESFLGNTNTMIMDKYGCEIHKLLFGIRVDGVVVYVGNRYYVYKLDRCNNQPLYTRLANTLASDIKTGEFKHHPKFKIAA